MRISSLIHKASGLLFGISLGYICALPSFLCCSLPFLQFSAPFRISICCSDAPPTTQFSLGQYGFLFDFGNIFWRLLLNLLMLTIPTVVLHIAIAVPAAYGFALLKSKLSNFLLFLYMVTLLMPRVVTLVPNYIAADWLNLLGSFWAVILPSVFTTIGVLCSASLFAPYPKAYWKPLNLRGQDMAQFCGIL